MKLVRGWTWIARIALVLGLLGYWPASGQAQETKSEPHPSPAEEEEEKTLSWGLDLDFVSKYIWRGINLNNDVSIQPNVWVSAYGFTAGLWFQVATEPLEDDNLEEIDLTLSYAHSFGQIGLEGGYLRYTYPGFTDVDSTNELYVIASYDTTLAPSLSVYRDLDLETWYLELGVGPEFSLSDKLSVNPGAVFGLYSSDEEGTQDLNRIEPSVALNYDIGGGFSATAHAHYVITLNDEIEDFYENRLWGGVGLHYEW